MHRLCLLPLLLLVLAAASARAQSPDAPPRSPASTRSPRYPITPAAETATPSDLRFIELPAPGFGFAISPRSGAVAAIDPETAQVMLYPALASAGSTANAVEVPIGAKAMLVTHKPLGNRGLFVVLCAGDANLYLIDDTKFTVSTLRLKNSDPRYLAVVPTATVPFAYYVRDTLTGQTPDPSSAQVCRVNLEAGTDDGPIAGVREATTIAVSAAGDVLYGARTPLPRGGAFACRLPAADAKLLSAATLAYHYELCPDFLPDPTGESVVCGLRLYNHELSSSVPLPGRVSCFLSDRPVALGYEHATLHFYSTNTWRPLAQLPLRPLGEDAARSGGPDRPPKTSYSIGNRLFEYPVVLLPDPKSGNLVACYSNRAALLPLRSLDLPSEPFLCVSVEGARQLHCGESASVRLVKLDARAIVELKQGPSGLKFVADTLTWTPTTRDVGVHRVLLTVTVAGSQRQQEISLTVRRAAVELPAIPQEVRLSADGKRLLAVMTAPSNGRRRLDGGPPMSPGTTDLAFVDVQKQAIVAQRTLPVTCRLAAIDGRFAYIAMSSADAFYALSLIDLADAKRIFTKAHLEAFAPLADKYLCTTAGQGGVTTYQLPDLTLRASDEGDPLRSYGGARPATLPGPLAGGWYLAGVLYDAGMQKPRLLVEPTAFLMLPPAGRRIPDPITRGEVAGGTVSKWGIRAVRSGLPGPGAQSLARSETLASIVLPDVPAAAALVRKIEQGNDPSQSRDTLSLVIRDLVTADEVLTLPLLDSIGLRSPPPDFDVHWEAGRHLLAGPGGIVAHFGRQIFFVSTTELPLAKLPTPLHFELTQSAFVLEPDQPTVLTFTATGGKPPIEYRLAFETPDLDIDKATGKVTIRPSGQRVAAAVPIILNHCSSHSGSDRQDRSLEQAVVAYQRQTAEQFTALTGLPATGIPLLLPLDLVAMDREQQIASLHGTIFFEVPLAAVQEQARQRDDAARARRDAAHPAAAPANATGGDAQQLLRRLQELEARNRELEVRVRVLTELLGPRAPATQPVGPVP